MAQLLACSTIHLPGADRLVMGSFGALGSKSAQKLRRSWPVARSKLATSNRGMTETGYTVTNTKMFF